MKINKFVFASHNQNKLNEIKQMLKNYKVEITSSKDYNLKDVEETGNTFAENAILKAKYVSEQTNLPALADDSGLEINALDGAPGIYSARWAGENKDYSTAINKIQNLLKGASDLSAQFTSVLALCAPSLKEPVIFTGIVKGTLTFPQKGTNGFAYDTIFIPNGYSKTFAEMESSLKNSLSHRKLAFTQFANKYLEII